MSGCATEIGSVPGGNGEARQLTPAMTLPGFAQSREFACDRRSPLGCGRLSCAEFGCSWMPSSRLGMKESCFCPAGGPIGNFRLRAISLAMLAVLTACGYWPDDQLPGEAATSKAATGDHPVTPEHVASLPAGQSRPVVNQLSNEVVAAETAPCSGNPDIDWEGCVSARMLKAFDRYGFLASHCRGQPDLKAVRNCVQFGRSGIDRLLAIGGAPDTDFDWSIRRSPMGQRSRS